MSASRFDQIPLAPPDAIFGLNIAFRADPDPRKVNLGVGAYRTEEGAPWVLNTVRKAEELVLQEHCNHEYLPIDGLPEFRELTAKLILGEDSPAIADKKVFAVQSLSGTGALRLAGATLARFFPEAQVYVSDPTWGNHNTIFGQCGFTVNKYRYWDSKARGLDLQGMLEDLERAPDGSIVVLHACAHNPTGVDPTQEQWADIARLMEAKGHIIIFDTAYQGFASGDPDKDGWAVRFFVEQGLEVFITQSYSKNFGLYGERIGGLVVACSNPKAAEQLHSQVKIMARGMYSNPPSFGARLVCKIMSNEDMYREWLEEIKTMADRINEMRGELRSELERLGCPGEWDHVTTQIGMFSYTGLTADQVKVMTEKHHIYLTGNGRISMAGLNSKNVTYVAEAIKDSIESSPSK